MATATEDQIRQVALQYGVDPAIALAVAQQESGFDQGARGSSGEVGIFQLMPATARGLNVDPYNQSQNIQGGVSYLAELYARFGDWTRALAGYNGGTNPPAVSYRYADSVLETATLYGAPAPSTNPPAAGGVPEQASIFRGVADIPVWAWLTLASVAVGALVLRRD